MSYRDKMHALINGWREVWDQGDFPFYYVQLAPFDYTWRSGLGEQAWPECEPGLDGARLRAGSAWTRAPTNCPRSGRPKRQPWSIRNTGMAVTNDIGNPADIHPTNKQEVGRRLSPVGIGQDLRPTGPGVLRTLVSVDGNEGRRHRAHF